MKLKYEEATEADWKALSDNLPGEFPDNLTNWEYYFDSGMKKFRLRAGVGINDTGANVWATVKDGEVFSI